MSTLQPRIYLASQSPRRRELLKQIGINFDVLLLRNDPRRITDVDETPHLNEPAVDYVQRVSRAKAVFGRDTLLTRNLRPFPLLAADTTVTQDNKIFGKPLNREDAATILRELSGKQHQVLTSVAVAHGDRVECSVSVTTVTFAKLDEERIRHYLLSNEWHDKAGAYGIQGVAGSFVQRIEGSYTGVMGLPLFETVELLRRFGHPVP
jgi:septum formation protein